MNREKFNTMAFIVRMSQGNPGALTAMVDLLANSNKVNPLDLGDPIGSIKILNDLEIQGTDVYLVWNDLCDRNVYYMTALILAVKYDLLDKQTLKNELAAINKGEAPTIVVKDVVRTVKNNLSFFDPGLLCSECYHYRQEE